MRGGPTRLHMLARGFADSLQGSQRLPDTVSRLRSHEPSTRRDAQAHQRGRHGGLDTVGESKPDRRGVGLIADVLQRAPRPLHMFDECRKLARVLNRHFGLAIPPLNAPPVVWKLNSALGGSRTSAPARGDPGWQSIGLTECSVDICANQPLVGPDRPEPLASRPGHRRSEAAGSIASWQPTRIQRPFASIQQAGRLAFACRARSAGYTAAHRI